MNTILSVSNLTKKFGTFTAVDDVSFQLNKGEILGLLGPNGAGKTTTIHMLLGTTTLTSGEILYFGKNLMTRRGEIMGEINFASAFNTLQGRVTVKENLLVYSKLYDVNKPLARIRDLLSSFEIAHLENERYWNLSAGQRTRVNLVKCLLNSPKIILLDEPTASLDPDISDKLLNLIDKLRSEQKVSILYTSHDMSEVSRICDRVVFMDHGKVIAEDTPLGLTKRIQNANIRLTFDAKKEHVGKILAGSRYKHEFLGNNIVSVTVKEKQIPAVIFVLSNADVWLTDIEVKKPTLEDFFLHIARKKKKQ